MRRSPALNISWPLVTQRRYEEDADLRDQPRFFPQLTGYMINHLVKASTYMMNSCTWFTSAGNCKQEAPRPTISQYYSCVNYGVGPAQCLSLCAQNWQL